VVLRGGTEHRSRRPFHQPDVGPVETSAETSVVRCLDQDDSGLQQFRLASADVSTTFRTDDARHRP